MDRNVFNNVALPLTIEGYSQHEMKRRVAAALDLVGLYGKEKFYPAMLSGGEQQRVALVRAIAPKPKVLLMVPSSKNAVELLTDNIGG